MKFFSKFAVIALVLFSSMNIFAQQGSGIERSVELGALFTSGNTEEQTLNFGAAMDINREQWDYRFSLDGIYSSSENEVKAQRYIGIASADYQITETSFFQTRASHEDDRFSGFDSQSDLTFSYGQDFLQNRANMDLSLGAGIGVRWTRQDGSDSDEPILRLAGEYDWTISESAVFSQDLSMDAGSDSDIYRSETAIETRVLDNLSLRFAINIKHQTKVPIGRENTDTQTAVTLVMEF